MTTKTKARKAVALLREHNIWRRGGDEKSEGIFHEPRAIGAALDTLCDFAESALAKEKKTRSTHT
jgi:hypothetical protein